jgi:hypothetical protein
MKHLKNFKSLLEGEEMLPIDMEPMDKGPMVGEPEIYAEEWIKSDKEEGDYDVTWTDENGEIVTASFSDVTQGPTPTDGKMGYLTFETLPGTSSDGNEYIGNVTLGEKKPSMFEITSIAIVKK